MLNKIERKLIVEEKDVTTVMAVINRHHSFFSNKKMTTGNCGWKDQPDKWYIYFYASGKEWGSIVGELSTLGNITVDVTPRGATVLHYVRN